MLLLDKLTPGVGPGRRAGEGISLGVFDHRKEAVARWYNADRDTTAEWSSVEVAHQQVFLLAYSRGDVSVRSS